MVLISMGWNRSLVESLHRNYLESWASRTESTKALILVRRAIPFATQFVVSVILSSKVSSPIIGRNGSE